MVDQLKNLIEQVVSQEVSKTSISNNFTSEVAKETGNSLINGFSGALKNGNISELMSLFNTDKKSVGANPLVKQIATGLATNLASKFGIDNKQASSFATSVIPLVISFIAAKSKSGEAGFNITDIISNLGGKNSGGILENLAGLALDKNGDGKVDFKDALSALTNKDSKNDKNSEGGLGGLLGGLFGK